MEPSNCKDCMPTRIARVFRPGRRSGFTSAAGCRTASASACFWIPGGRAVFYIGVGWALDADPKLSKLLRNVLHHLAGVTARTPYDPEWLDPQK